MSKRCIFITLCLLLAAGTLLGDAIPQPSGWVNDFAGVISSEYRNKLTSLIRELESKTSAEIAVVTMDSIAPYDEKTYARLLFDNWKPGKKGKDNGVLILLAIKERLWRIETGYGVEGILPDGLCGEIGRNYMVPYFKEGKYGEGFYYTTAEIARVISNGEIAITPPLKTYARKSPAKQNVPFFVYIFILVFFFIWNLPWPFPIGVVFTSFFAGVFFHISTALGVLTIVAYVASMTVRLLYWIKQPSRKRKNFFGMQDFGAAHSGSNWSSWNSGGGFSSSGGFGGFGGGGGGGGGAGGRF
ncbi:MAG: TPM domain-containing protein [Candidatus Omnitrophica bacterium]|nr:TPM domain-containing protein [Candidatus Omnitrophota bacterium]